VPELARLPAEWIHQPWAAPAAVLAAAGVELGRTYPKPIVDLASSRAAALAAFQQLRQP
jgi:deoxyribodipyrimidine photo-lyase